MSTDVSRPLHKPAPFVRLFLESLSGTAMFQQLALGVAMFGYGCVGNVNIPKHGQSSSDNHDQ